MEIIKSPISGKAVQKEGLLQVVDPTMDIGYSTYLNADENTAKGVKLLKKKYVSYSGKEGNGFNDVRFLEDGEMLIEFSFNHIEVLRCK